MEQTRGKNNIRENNQEITQRILIVMVQERKMDMIMANHGKYKKHEI